MFNRNRAITGLFIACVFIHYSGVVFADPSGALATSRKAGPKKISVLVYDRGFAPLNEWA